MIRDKRGQHADGESLPWTTLQAPNAQMTSRPTSVSNVTVGPKNDHRAIDAVVGLEHVLVAAAEAFDFALLLCERLHDANAGNRVGQYVYHFGPGGAAAGKAVPQPDAHLLHHPGDKRERQQRGDGQGRIDPQAGRRRS